MKIELKNGVYEVTKESIIKAREFLTMDDKNNFKDSEKFELMKSKTLSGKYDSRPSMEYVTLNYAHPELLKDVSFTEFCNKYYIENK